MYLKFLLKAACLLLLLPSALVYSGNVYEPNDEEPIAIIPAEQGSKHRPHSNAFVPFEANYNAGLASVLLCGLDVNARDKSTPLILKEYSDSVLSRYGMRISVPKNYTVDVFDEATIWSLAAASEYGNPMWDYFARLISKDGNCMILLESVPAYNENVILRKIKNKTADMCREMSYVLDDGESGFRGISKIEDYSKVTEYDHAKSMRLFGADKVYSYVVPYGKTAFCYIHPSVDEKVPYIQSLYRDKYPEMRRYFFTKDGYVTYSLTMLLSSKGVLHEKKYIKVLKHVVDYGK